MGKASVDEALSILHKRKVPNVAFPERVASILSAMIQRREWLNIRREQEDPFDVVDRESALEFASAGDWSSLLEAYGINLPPQKAVRTVDEAVKSADMIGYPLVLKIVSDEITHKTEVDGVKLGIHNEDELRKAWSEIAESAERVNAAMKGGMIQKMLQGGYEVIIGIRQDEQFGPMVLFGTGGTDVELLKDVATGIAPLNRLQAEHLINQTRAGEKLKGWRNQPAADRGTVIEYLLRMAQLADDLPEVMELEINPLYVMPRGEGAYAIDIRGNFTED
jgi:acetyltransferase